MVQDTITKEEVEKCKERDLLENMLAEMAGEFPALSRVHETFLSNMQRYSRELIRIQICSDP